MLQQHRTFVRRLDDSSAPSDSMAPAAQPSKAGETCYLPLNFLNGDVACTYFCLQSAMPVRSFFTCDGAPICYHH